MSTLPTTMEKARALDRKDPVMARARAQAPGRRRMGVGEEFLAAPVAVIALCIAWWWSEVLPAPGVTRKSLKRLAQLVLLCAALVGWWVVVGPSLGAALVELAALGAVGIVPPVRDARAKRLAEMLASTDAARQPHGAFDHLPRPARGHRSHRVGLGRPRQRPGRKRRSSSTK